MRTFLAKGSCAVETHLQPLLLADAVSSACLSLHGLTGDSGAADMHVDTATSELLAAAQQYIADLTDLAAKVPGAETDIADTPGTPGKAVPPGMGADADAVAKHLSACADVFEARLNRFGEAAAMCSASITARGNRLDGEMGDAAASVDVAAARISALMAAAKADMGEKTLSIHGSILDASMLLMRLIGQLIATTTGLQKEIIAAETTGVHSLSVTQFYKKNSRWIDGLVSGAKAVGAGATVLVDTADAVLRGEAQMEELMVAGESADETSNSLLPAGYHQPSIPAACDGFAGLATTRCNGCLAAAGTAVARCRDAWLLRASR